MENKNYEKVVIPVVTHLQRLRLFPDHSAHRSGSHGLVHDSQPQIRHHERPHRDLQPLGCHRLPATKIFLSFLRIQIPPDGRRRQGTVFPQQPWRATKRLVRPGKLELPATEHKIPCPSPSRKLCHLCRRRAAHKPAGRRPPFHQHSRCVRRTGAPLPLGGDLRGRRDIHI